MPFTFDIPGGVSDFSVSVFPKPGPEIMCGGRSFRIYEVDAVKQ